VTITALLGVLSFVFTLFLYGFLFGAIYSPLGKRFNNLHPPAGFRLWR
jgi:thiosulfate dehydrogenase (quinone)